MADVTIRSGNEALAAFEQGDTYIEVELFAGNTPLPATQDFPVAASVAIPAFSVVGLSGGNLVLATQSKTVQAIGITTAEVTSRAAAQSVAVFRSGCFNPAALNWDASYTTDAHKKAAFDAAPTPTVILIKKTVG